MRAPDFKNGNFLVKYRQVPYDDRYFTVLHKGREMFSFRHSWWERFGSDMLGLMVKEAQRDHDESFFVRLEKFAGRVHKYNEYLDSFDD